MSRFDGNIVVGTSVDVGGINTGLNKITGAFNKLARHISNGPLTKLFASAASAASDLVEVQNVVDVSFESMSWKAERFARNAIEQFGMSELAAKRTASSFMAMGKAAGIGMENASNMAINLAALTGDFASFYNISQDYARVALSAVYTGETETLKRYGIILTEANLQQYALSQGIEKNVKLMDAREKLMLRYMYVTEVTKDMQGDFIRTQESFANQTRLLSQSWKQFLIVLGNGVTTAMVPALKMLGQLLIKLRQFTMLVLSILSNIFGIDFSMPTHEMDGYADSVEDAAEAEEELADGVGKATKAAWKALAPFDELNVLRTPSSGSGGAAASAIDPFAGFNVDSLYDFPDKLDEILKSAIDTWYDFGKWLSDGFASLLDKIPWDKIFATARKFGTNLADFLNGIFQPRNFTKAGQTIANALNTIIYAIQSFLKKFNFKKAGLSVANFLNGIIDTFDFEAAGDTINRLVKGIETFIKIVLKTVKWKKLLAGIKTILKQVPWEVWLIAGLGILGKLLSKLIMEVIVPFISFAIRAAIFKALQSVNVKAILTAIGKLLSSIFWKVLSIPAINKLLTTILSKLAALLTGFEAKVAKMFTFEKLVEPVAGLENGVESATGLYKVVYNIWTFITKIGAWLANLQGMDVMAILGGEAGIAGGAVAAAEVIFAAIAGYFTGKNLLGPLLDPEDKDWYKEFSFFGDDGFFATAVQNFTSISDAIQQMYTDLDGIGLYIDPLTSLFASVQGFIDALIEGDSEKAGSNLFTGLLSAINTLVPPLTLIEYLINRFAPDDVKQRVLDFFTTIGEKLTAISTSFLEKVAAIWVVVSGFFQGLWDDFVTYLLTPIVDGIKAVWSVIYGILYRIGQIIYGLYIIWHAYFVLLWKEIVSAFTVIKDAIVAKVMVIWNFIKDKAETIWAFIQNILTIAWTAISTTITTVNNFFYNNLIVPVTGFITTLWAFIVQVLATIWNECKRIFTNIWTSIKTIVIDPIKKMLTTAWTFIKTHFVDPVVNGITTAITKLETILGTFWDTLKNGIKGFANAGIGVVETMLNHIIDSINNFLNFFNGAVRVAASISGDPWTDIATINHVSIPRLASGAVIPPNAPFLAMLGDQKHGTNVETPLETIKQAVVEAMASGGFGGNGEIHIHCEIDGREIGRAVVKQNDIYKKSTGRSLI